VRATPSRASAEAVDERGRGNHDEGDRDQLLRSAADAGLREAERERGRGRGGDDPARRHPGDERPLTRLKLRAQGRKPTASGRPRNTSTAMNAALTQPISAIWCGVTRAERMMNRVPIRKVVREAIRARQARVSLPIGVRAPGARSRGVGG
jgi:hypothetical protein